MRSPTDVAANKMESEEMTPAQMLALDQFLKRLLTENQIANIEVVGWTLTYLVNSDTAVGMHTVSAPSTQEKK